MDLTAQYPFFRGEKPRVIGHRGAAGDAPENTLPSFQRAFAAGAECVEIDVRGSKDGEVVIIHDAGLGRTTNGRGSVSQKLLSEIKGLDAGYRFSSDGGLSFPCRGQRIEVPTLEEYLSSFATPKAIIEIKQARPAIVERVIETVCRLGKEKSVLLATENDTIMRAVRKELQRRELKIASGFSYGEVAAFLEWVAQGKRKPYIPSGQSLQIPCEYNGMTLVTEATVAAAHEVGVEIFVWTVNESAEMERLLRLGVDGIITDYPSRLFELVSGKPGWKNSLVAPNEIK